MLLATTNTVFSLIDPIIFGKIIKLSQDINTRQENGSPFGWDEFFAATVVLLLMSMGTAMVSRIAKNMQDYFANVVIQKFGAKIFTDGLQHAMKLPYQEFEDQRSGETLSVLTKVRTDTEKFINYFVNALFAIVVGVVFVFVYASVYIHWSVPVAYVLGISLLSWGTNALSKKVKIIQKKIVSSTTSLAGTTTESLRNIELVKSLGLTQQEVKRLNADTYKILGLELTKVKRIRSISVLQGTLVNTLRQVILFLLMYFLLAGSMEAEERELATTLGSGRATAGDSGGLPP
jgi:ATP-binding cassette subfamily B protein